MPETKTPAQREAAVRTAASPLERVLALTRVLRGPGGCPWDREQTVESMTPYLQEETFEVVEAISARDHGAFREELGDLLFLVLFLGEVAEEDGWGDVNGIADATVEKLIRRHPHVFGEGHELGTGGALRQWEEIKRDEKRGETGVPSSLGERPAGLPALTTAFRISEKAGAVGFQWPEVRDAVRKIEEETGELSAEIESGVDVERLEHELGDLLYSVVNLARYLRIDPERALRGTVRKFMNRFHYVEEALHARGKGPEQASLEEMDALWNEAKEKGIS